MAKAAPRVEDPLNDHRTNAGAYSGAILLSDQIHYYIDELDPPLLHNPKGKQITKKELDECLDAASYKLRLGDEANVGGEWMRVSADKPLVIPAHQVAVIKTHEEVNLPRFLIARWNLRVKWVYEGLLWTGGPQVDPGWQGHLYCPIYNLAERQIVIPHKERVFTMDFVLTTPPPPPEDTTTEGYTKSGHTKDGYKVSVHRGQRGKTIQSHDVNRLRSAPFEQLRQLANLDARVSSFNTFTFLVLAVVVAAIGVIAALGGSQVAGNGSDAVDAVQETANGGGANLVLSVVAVAFGFAGLLIGSISMTMRFSSVLKGGWRLLSLPISGATLLALGSGYVGHWITSGLPIWPHSLGVVAAAGSICAIVLAFVCLWYMWRHAAG